MFSTTYYPFRFLFFRKHLFVFFFTFGLFYPVVYIVFLLCFTSATPTVCTPKTGSSAAILGYSPAIAGACPPQKRKFANSWNLQTACAFPFFLWAEQPHGFAFWRTALPPPSPTCKSPLSTLIAGLLLAAGGGGRAAAPNPLPPPWGGC